MTINERILMAMVFEMRKMMTSAITPNDLKAMRDYIQDSNRNDWLAKFMRENHLH